MKALVLAYDKGKDLKPLTTTMPKGMLPVLNKPVLERNLERLKKAGFDEIGLVIGYLGHKIREYFLNGDRLGVRIQYLPMQSAWQATVAPFADDELLVLEGEWVSQADIEAFWKQRGGNVVGDGMYLVQKDFFKELNTDKPIRELISEGAHRFLEADKKANRLSNIAEYMQANLQGEILTGKGTKIDSSAYLSGSVVVGDHVTIDGGCVIKDSIVMDNAHICKDCEIENAVIGRDVLIKSGTFVFDYGVIGQGAKIGSNVFVKTDSRIPPFKIISDQATVGVHETPATLSSVSIWNGELSGSVFAEITPEFSVKAGKSMVYLLGTQKKIGISWDGNAQTYPVYSGFLAGLTGSGGNIFDCQVQKYPVFHTLAVRNKLDLSVYISANGGECTFSFIDQNGDTPSVHKQKQLELVINRNEGEPLSGIPYKRQNLSIEYAAELKELSLPVDFAIRVICKDGFARQALCMYKQTEQNPNICFCLNERMDKMTIEGLEEREMQVLYSIILLESYDEKVKTEGALPKVLSQIVSGYADRRKTMEEVPFVNRLKGDGILGCVLVLNYMCRNQLTKEELLAKIPRFFTVSREIEVENQKRESVVRKITNGKSTGKVKIVKDGGWVMIIPHGRKNSFQVVSEGYNKEYAQDLLEYYVNLIKETEEEV